MYLNLMYITQEIQQFLKLAQGHFNHFLLFVYIFEELHLKPKGKLMQLEHKPKVFFQLYQDMP